jgi:hypothetical protein
MRSYSASNDDMKQEDQLSYSILNDNEVSRSSRRMEFIASQLVDLPESLQQVIFSYYMEPTLEFIHQATKHFGPNLMAPFLKALHKDVKPFLDEYTLGNIFKHQQKVMPNEGPVEGWLSSLNAVTKNIMIDIMNELEARPLSLQLAVLNDVYHEINNYLWVSQINNLNLTVLKDKLVAIGTNQKTLNQDEHDDRELEFKIKLRKIIYKKMKELISQALTTAFIDTDTNANSAVIINIPSSRQTSKELTKEISRIERNNNRLASFGRKNAIIAAFTMFISILVTAFGPTDNIKKSSAVVASASIIDLLAVSFILLCMHSMNKKKITFLNTAQQRFFRLERARDEALAKEAKDEESSISMIRAFANL